MTGDVGFPRVEIYLPGVMRFVAGLVEDHRAGEMQSWEALAERVHAFFTPERLDQVEAVLPGWREMSSCANGVTPVHVMCAFIGLLTSPEYQRASPAQQAEVEWIVLLHDLAKWVRTGERDYKHPFPSAAQAGAILAGVGFPVTDAYERGFDEWSTLVHGAFIVTQEGQRTLHIQDNDKLPEIVVGIERLYGLDTPAALIVKTILLHTSITNLQAWPQAAPLTEAEIKQFVTREVYPLLKMTMLADNDGWELFNASTRETYRRETLEVFDQVADLTGFSSV
jgi:hypothetical protein